MTAKRAKTTIIHETYNGNCFTNTMLCPKGRREDCCTKTASNGRVPISLARRLSANAATMHARMHTSTHPGFKAKTQNSGEGEKRKKEGYQCNRMFILQTTNTFWPRVLFFTFVTHIILSLFWTSAALSVAKL